MTLDKTVRYDSDRVQERGDRAVVLGASMAGLMAARVLTDAYGEVTVVERDDLDGGATPRRGVPQGKHVHVLLEAGRATISDLFPGYGEDLIAAGGLIISVGGELRHYEGGGYLATPATRMELYCASRPLLESVARDRLVAFDGVTVRDGCQFVDYVTDADQDVVEGVRIRDDGTEESVRTDLVVDATGRTSRTPNWLSDHGYEAPPVDEVGIDIEYSSIRLARPAGDRRMIFAPQSAPRTHGGAAFPVENGEWLVTLGGMHETDPPADPDGFAEFAAELPTEGIERVLAEHEVVSEGVQRYPFPSNKRHRYEDLDRFPEGLVVVGDAIASFNPIYGQGMSTAALEALQLHRTLATTDSSALGRRFFDAAEDVVDIAWSMAVGSDHEFDQTTGPQPDGGGLFTRYFSRFVRAAHDDPVLSKAFYRVTGMEKPPTYLLQPGFVWRTFRS